MKSEFRKTEGIGSYGGEEFAVVLPETEAEAGARVMYGVRSAFAKVVHHSDAGEFAVTMSAGIVDFAGRPDAACMIEAADQALYRAKKGGRNRAERAE